MNKRIESEITFFSRNDVDLPELMNNFIVEAIGARPKRCDFKSRLYLMFDGSEHDKSKMAVRLNNGKLYYRLSYKDVVQDTIYLQRYLEEHANWKGFDEIRNDLKGCRIIACYYKDKFVRKFRFRGVSYRISGDRTLFIDARTRIINDLVNYVELETMDEFSEELIAVSRSHFLSINGFRPIDDANTKQSIGSSCSVGGAVSPGDMNDLKGLIYDMYKAAYGYFLG